MKKTKALQSDFVVWTVIVSFFLLLTAFSVNFDNLYSSVKKKKKAKAERAIIHEEAASSNVVVLY